MKKSLIIFLSLIFINMTAHAVGVDCWEEVDATFNPNTVSKMQAVLGNNVEITRVKTELKMLMYERHLYDCSTATCYHYEPVTIYMNTYSAYNYNQANHPYYLEIQENTTKTSKDSGWYQGGLYSQSWKAYFKLGFDYRYMLTHKDLAGDVAGNTYGIYEYRSEDNKYASHAMFVHTYCIENTNSGGGGGAAGASVNYIIKAN